MVEKKIIIGLVGKIAAGKGTIAKHLEENYGANTYRFSTMLRDVMDRLYQDKNRENLQTVSTLLRQYFGEDILAKVIARDVIADKNKFIVVDGIRRMADIKYLRENPNFYLIRIETSPENRFERIKKRAENTDDTNKTFAEFLIDENREADQEVPMVMEQANFAIDNNSSFDNLYRQVDETIEKIVAASADLTFAKSNQAIDPSRKGLFVVIDGTDGSGKATQTQLLVDRLTKAGFSVEMMDFPQYGQKSAGLVEEYLNGKYGPADEVGPYRASIFYASDRYDASFKLKKWLEEGKIVISNRYVTANMGHQGGKIADDEERKKYFEWLYSLEYEIFNIPKPDLNIILHVDAAVAQKLVDQKGARDYVGGEKRDIHEADINHLRNAEKVYIEIAHTFSNFKLINCTRNNEIMSREAISDLVWKEMERLTCNKFPKYSPNFVELHEQLKEQASQQIKISAMPAAEHPELSLKVERLSPAAKIPTRSHDTDAGLDLYACEAQNIFPGERAIIKNGIRIAIPAGYVGLIWDKSGVAAKAGMHTMAGVIDAGYRGELAVNVVNLSRDVYRIEPGQKIAQLLLQKIELPQIIEGRVDDDTQRGPNGFGSTGLF